MSSKTRDKIIREHLAASKNRAIVLRAAKHREARQERRRGRAKRRAARQTEMGMQPATAALSAAQVLAGSLVAWLSRHDPRLSTIIRDAMKIEDGRLLLPFSEAVPKTIQNVRDVRAIASRCGFKMTLTRSGVMKFTP